MTSHPAQRSGFPIVMKKCFIIFTFIITSIVVISRERPKVNPPLGVDEGCVSCHSQVQDPDRFHPISAYGCYTCHLGNPYSYEKSRAHHLMVRNPGNLRIVHQTCGKIGCHTEIVSRVKKSLMATNAGILKKLQHGWETERPPVSTVEELLDQRCERNLALDYYCKMCGGCHLWKKRWDREGEVGRRGGGCSNCHVVDESKRTKWDNSKGSTHPKLTTRIPSENCIKCHNRSGRIGLSYFGKYESDGYGTPYTGRKLNPRTLSGYRYFINLPPDIHFSKLGLDCIDCHTSTGIMGDGEQYDHMDQQVDITCEACHRPCFQSIEKEGSLALRLAEFNGRMPEMENVSIGKSNRGTPLYHLQKRGGKVLLFRKRDGHAIALDNLSPTKAYHQLSGHERLSCQACHSQWMPQCYGCHLRYQPTELQKDWLTDEPSLGRWTERRSYLRFERPALGVSKGSKIYPVSPCQVIVSGAPVDLNKTTISAFDPHTTSTKSRKCIECHGESKVLGFGEGILNLRAGNIAFRPTYRSMPLSGEMLQPIQGFDTEQGKAEKKDRSKGVRPFNQKELHGILSVNPCLGCHDRYEDKIYRDFQASLARFDSEKGLPCVK
jgi:hypothetical protein